MPKKNNIRSIRFSDELAELIDRQQGDSFTQKFENLITKCVWELPKKEEELKAIEARIQERQEQLQKKYDQLRKLTVTLNNLLPKMIDLERSIDQETEKWDM